MANQNWNDWKFQIHWNKLEYLNPISRNEQNNLLFVSSKILCLKDNNKTVYCVGHSKVYPQMQYILQKKIVIDEIQSS